MDLGREYLDGYGARKQTESVNRAADLRVCVRPGPAHAAEIGRLPEKIKKSVTF